MSPELNVQVVPLAEVPKNESSALDANHLPVVLIVDDEHVIADTVAIILKKSGYAVLTAYDGKTALEIASVIPPELLITDVFMPDMDGIELALVLTRNIPDCKVLLFSGQASTADLLVKAHDSGNNFTLLAKPVHPSEMLRRISECFQKQDESAIAAQI